MKLTCLIISFLILAGVSHAQSFLNGSFETTTAAADCNYNISNTAFNGYFPNVTAFGAYEAIDIQVAGCYVPTIADGTFALALANFPNDPSEGEAIALELSEPLVAGNSYSMSFQAYAMPEFSSEQGDLMIGASMSGTEAGETVYTAATVYDTWTTFEFEFVAPNNATHITVVPVAGIPSWNSIDDFAIDVACEVAEGMDEVEACNSYTWIDGQTYTEDNTTATYLIEGGAVNGCDSLVTLDLTVHALDLSVTTEQNVLTSNQDNASYQWVDCPAMTPIPDATTQTYTATADGDYAVIVTTAECSDTSACYTVMGQSIENAVQLPSISVYPNPVNHEFTVEFDEFTQVTITLFDEAGREVRRGSYSGVKRVVMEVVDLAPGVYVVRVETEWGVKKVKLVKE